MYPSGEYRGKSSLRSECVVNGDLSPVPGQEFVDPLDGMPGDASEDVG
jgi:hypothetical protein